MAINNKLKAFVRYANNKVVAGSMVMQAKKPAVGKWEEIPMYNNCCVAPSLALRLLFSDIAAVNAIVGDSSNVADWNTYFDLPVYGSPFTSVTLVGNEVKLFGGSNITLKDELFDQPDELGIYLLEIHDDALCVIAGGNDCFGDDNNAGCPNLTTAIFPAMVTAGNILFISCDSLTTVHLPVLSSAGHVCFSACVLLTTIDLPLLSSFGYGFFNSCMSLTTINLPSCQNLGPTVGDDGVFSNITGNTITLTVPAALMTANAGNPDGDIVYLQANNTVTIITV